MPAPSLPHIPGRRAPVLGLLILLPLTASCAADVPGPLAPEPTPEAVVAAVLTLDLDAPDNYADPPLPAHYRGPAAVAMNTPADNPVTDRGATLGRVLFYDRNLSVNGTVSCASCHAQALGFTDAATFSQGFAGGRTGAHSMRLGNAVYYRGQDMFWDRRALDLEDQVLQPVMDGVEMGFDAAAGGLPALIARLEATSYLPVLFEWAFGTPDITEERLRRALAQFIRAMVSAGSRYDDAVAAAGPVGPGGLAGPLPGLTPQENQGLALFTLPRNQGGAGCAGCHQPPTMALDPASRSNGLDAGETVIFKSPSLKSVAAAPGYMHDGRFRTLAEVVEHYDGGVQPGPPLDNRLRGPGGQPVRLNLTAAEKAALVAYLETLTDTALLADPRFSDPFRR